MVSVQGPRRLRRYERRESVSRFLGLNVEQDPDLIRDQEFQDLLNFNVTPARILVKRPGFRIWSQQTGIGASKILGVYDTGAIAQLVASFTDGVNSRTYASTDGGLTWGTTVSGTRAFRFAVQYNSFLYLVDSTGVAKWNGTTLTAVSGSPGGSHIVAFKDRLWVCDGATSSNLYYSDPGPSGVDTWGVSSVIKVRTGDPSSLVASLPFADRLMLFKTMTVWQLYLAGNVASWQLKILNTERGAISENAVLTFQGMIYMLSWDGVWRSDGAIFRELSNRVRKYFKQSPQPYRDVSSALSLSNRRLLVTYRQYSLPLENGVMPCACLWYNLDADAWSRMEVPDAVGKWRPLSIFNWYNPGSLTTLPPTLQLVDSWSVDPNDTRTIYLLDDTIATDKGFPFYSYAETKIFDFGDVFDMKRCKVFLPEFDSPDGAIPMITYKVDNKLEEVHVPAGSLVVKDPKVYRVEGPGYLRQLSVCIHESSSARMRILTLNFILMLKSVVGADT